MKKAPIVFIALVGVLMLTLSTLSFSEETAEATYNDNQIEQTEARELGHPWDLVPWLGPNNVPIEDALGDIIQHVSVVWSWSNEDQEWSAYFVEADFPGVNDLKVLMHDQPYWIATDQPGVVWEMPVVDESDEETPTNEPAQENTPTPMPTDTPVPTNTPEPTEEPTEVHTATPTQEPTETPTPEPTPTATPEPECGGEAYETFTSPGPSEEPPYVSEITVDPAIPCDGDTITVTGNVDESRPADAMTVEFINGEECIGPLEMSETSPNTWSVTHVFSGEVDDDWGYRLIAFQTDGLNSGYISPIQGDPPQDRDVCGDPPEQP